MVATANEELCFCCLNSAYPVIGARAVRIYGELLIRGLPDVPLEVVPNHTIGAVILEE